MSPQLPTGAGRRHLLALLVLALVLAAAIIIGSHSNKEPGKTAAKGSKNVPHKPKPLPPPPSYPTFKGPVKLLPPHYPLIYHTAHPDFGPVEALVTAQRVENFAELAGKKIVWASFADNWFKGIRFPAKQAEAIWSTGTVPFVRVMPRIDFHNGCGGPYTLQRFLQGRFDKQLHRYARDVERTHIPVMLDFLPEPNGWWFPWGGSCNGNSVGAWRYKAVWRHVEGIFKQEHAYNVTWVFHPDTVSSSSASWDSVASYYPGDNYVDWVGISNYGPQRPTYSWWSLTATFNSAYQRMALTTKKKPLALIETGVVESPSYSKAQWIKDAFTALSRRNYPRLAAVGWWQSNFVIDGIWSLVRIDSSPSALAAYRSEISARRFTDKPRLSAQPMSKTEARALFAAAAKK